MQENIQITCSADSSTWDRFQLIIDSMRHESIVPFVVAGA